ncbi:MAG: hypothetical protein N3B21_15450 [Clostridia bacterium]|nr:hypothetical protein [Clostridia bacterium]
MDWNFVVIAIILAAFAILPIIIDIILAYWSQNKARSLIIEKAAANNLEKEELAELLRGIGKAPNGISGIARVMMTLTVLVILGISVLYILFKNDNSNMETAKTILSMFGGILATITGFYFGGRAVEKKSDHVTLPKRSNEQIPG